MVPGSWNIEYFQAAAEVLCTCIYIYTHMDKHIYSVTVLVLIFKLAHFKLILINLQFCTVYVHLYTYNACISIYTHVHTYMCVSCRFFRINLRQASLDTNTIPAASTTFPVRYKPILWRQDTAACQVAGEKCLCLNVFSAFKSAGHSANAEAFLYQLGLTPYRVGRIRPYQKADWTR